MLSWVGRLAAQEQVVGIVGLHKADHTYVAFKAGMRTAIADAGEKGIALKDFTSRSERWSDRIAAFENAVGAGCTTVFFFFKSEEAFESVREAAMVAGVEVAGVPRVFLKTDSGEWGLEQLMALESGALEQLVWYEYEASGQQAMTDFINDIKRSLIRVDSVTLITKAEAGELLKKWERWLAEPAE